MLMYLIVGYIALYLVILSHEVGHAYFYKKYGCKDNPFNVTIPLYLAFSTPEPVDLEKEKNLSLKQKFIVAMGGILVNLIFGIIGLVLLNIIKIEDNVFHFFFYTFILFHFIEVASYTVINNIYVASDIVGVQNYKPKYRIPLFVIGLIVTYIIIILLINSPGTWRIGLVIATILIAFIMGVLRIIFSILMNNKQKDVKMNL